MAVSEETRQLPVSYLQLIVRRFDADPVLRTQILAGVSLNSEEAEESGFEIIYTQLMRLFENMRDAFGEGWFIDFPELWRPAAQGALGVACLSAPTVGAAMQVLARYMPARFANIRVWTPLRMQEVFREIERAGSGASVCPAC